jgi:15-cis-phytoene synthase
MTTVTISVAEAFERCELITRTQARNFYYGIRLLRPHKRAALCAVYALARRIDDIGDGELPRADKIAALAQLRTSVAALRSAENNVGRYEGNDLVLIAVADVARRMSLPVATFDELIDGVEMDVRGRRYTDFDELVGYCRCVAGAIGRLCLAVFGHRPDLRAPEYADALGIALQQINILRDIREDLGNGRIYLPQDDLDRFGVQLSLAADGTLEDPNGQLSELIRYSAERAYRWYSHGLRLIPLLDRRSAACCTAMSGIYLRLLDRIVAQPSLVFDRRLSLSGWQKAEVAMRALVGSSSVGAAQPGVSA